MANVNRPTNEAQKEKDINQKLQLYGEFRGKTVKKTDLIQESTLPLQMEKSHQTNKSM